MDATARRVTRDGKNLTRNRGVSLRRTEESGNPQRTQARTQLAYWALLETAKFFNPEAGYVSALCGIHVACFLFVFCIGRLAVPQVRHELEGMPLFFLRRG